MEHGIRGGVSAGPGRKSEVSALGRDFRDAMARWPSGVTVAAVREERAVHAITATSFCSVSVEPPLVAVSVGPNATVLPALEPGAPLAISILSDTQRRLASMFADPAPIGREVFAPEGAPVIPDAVFAFECVVEALHPAGDHTLVIARVTRVVQGRGKRPLVRYDRKWRTLDHP